jgi:exonuclease SbcC
MIIHTIELQGFSSYKDYTRVEVPVGITGIIGSYEGFFGKSNGSGKSSLIESILFAFFKRGNFDVIDDVWNDQLTKKDKAFVKVTFEIDNIIYSVERGRKSSGSYIDVKSNDVLVADSEKESQSYINNLFGLDSTLFTSSVFFKQGELLEFIDGDSASRKAQLDNLLSINYWREVIKLVSDEIKVCENNISTTTSLVETQRSQVLANNKIIENYKKEIESLDDLSLKKDALVDKLNSLRIASQSVEKIVNLEKMIITLKTEIESKELSYVDKCNLLKIKNEEISRIESELLKVDILDELKNKISEITKSITFYQNKIDVDEIEVKPLLENKSILQYKISHAKDSIHNLYAGVCPSCGQEISEQYIVSLHKEIDSKIMELTNELAVIDTPLNKALQELQISKNMLQSIQERKVLCEKELQDKHTTVLSLQRNLDRLTIERDVLVSEIPILTKGITDKKNLLQSREEEYKLVQIDSSDTKVLDTIKLVENQISTISNDINALYVKKGIIENLLTTNLTTVNNLRELNNTLVIENDNFEVKSLVFDVFKKIPSNVIQSSIQSINYFTNIFVKKVFPNFSIELYEDSVKKSLPLKVGIYVDGVRRVFSRFSGGEQCICAIAMRIGFSKVIYQQSKVNIGILVLDEVLGSLDKHNRDMVISALVEWNKTFPQILVISHTDEVSDLPNIISVHKNIQGISSIA